ncbi:NAD(P)H-binding protein [Streptomyces sp. NPDC006704]|uniref:NAD(P)H-binding protein n=1 Tax=Streptomyces sp. NPDC006704 TaxID=3364760 RepID=UPI0036B5889C
MILVTGATGTVGREVVGQLSGREQLRVMARDPRRVTCAGASDEVVAGDYADQESLVRALRGVRAAFVVTTRVGGGDDAAFVTAARAAGVRHLVKLSAAAVRDPLADDFITTWQRDAEDTIRASGLDWTFLRPRSFMSNTLSWAPTIRAEGVVRALYGNAPNASVDPRDIARAAAVALTEPGHEGRAYTLTGPDALSAAQQTKQLAEVLGRPVAFEELGPDRARELWASRYPGPVVEALLHSAERQLAGAKREVDDTVHRLTGRPATSYATWARDHADAFAPQDVPQDAH